MSTHQRLTHEERAERARAQRLAMFEGDAEMQEAIRTTPFDFEVPWDSTPEETAEDIRISRERAAKGKTISLEEFFRRQAEKFPEEAEELLRDL